MVCSVGMSPASRLTTHDLIALHYIYIGVFEFVMNQPVIALKDHLAYILYILSGFAVIFATPIQSNETSYRLHCLVPECQAHPTQKVKSARVCAYIYVLHI